MLCAGSNVSLTLYFMRFAFWLNVLMLAIWVVLAVFPFFDSPPASFSWQLFKETSPGLMVQGYGLDDTFLVYGKSTWAYSNKHHAILNCGAIACVGCGLSSHPPGCGASACDVLQQVALNFIPCCLVHSVTAAQHLLGNMCLL